MVKDLNVLGQSKARLVRQTSAIVLLLPLGSSTKE